MKKVIDVNVTEPVIHLSTEVVFGHRVAWAGVDYRQLRASIIKPRVHFDYDSKEKRPLLLFIAGGGFTEMDRNAWIPDLVWFARNGFVVASVDYSVTARTNYPMQIEDVKLAVRYLRAHADEFGIDESKIVVMGESAGGYLAGLAALTNGDTGLDVGEYCEVSSAVNAAICIYPAVDVKRLLNGAPSLQDLVTPDSPPIMILQGDSDSLVDPALHSEILYEALEKNGVPNEYYLVKGANHAAAEFYQDETKQLIADFITKNI